MRVVVDRDQYKISIDDKKNRLFLQIWGDVDDPKRFEDFPDDWAKALSHVSPGFTVLADYTQTGVFFLPHIWKKAQFKIFEAGVSKVAVFWGNRVLGNLRLNKQPRKPQVNTPRNDGLSKLVLTLKHGWMSERSFGYLI